MGLLASIGIKILRIIGFAVTGPIRGSLAALIQSVFYGGAVVSRSLFAIAQSITMASS